MKWVWKRWWCWLALSAVGGGLALLAFCWTHRVWSLNEWRVYQAMDAHCHPVWRELHFGRIRAGDPVDEVIAGTKPIRVKRAGGWVVLSYQEYPGGLCFTGVTVAAYEGRLVCAYAWSSAWVRQFFDVMSEEQRAEFFREHYDQPVLRGGAIIIH
jgi:hypothetical protein